MSYNYQVQDTNKFDVLFYISAFFPARKRLWKLVGHWNKYLALCDRHGDDMLPDDSAGTKQDLHKRLFVIKIQGS